MVGIIRKVQRWIPIVHIMVLCIGTTLSFITAYFHGDISLYLPFISETGAFTPANCIFSLFLIIGSFTGCIMMFFNYLMLNGSHTDEIWHFKEINSWTFLVGLISMLGLAGVAAFPMTTVFWAHLIAAAIYFMGSCLYFIGVTFITKRIFGMCHMFIFRSILIGTLIVLLLLLTCCFPVALSNWKEKNVDIPARKKPEDEGFTLILIASVFEWIIVLIILLFNLSLMKLLSLHKVVITTIPGDRRGDQDIGLVLFHTESYQNLPP